MGRKKFDLLSMKDAEAIRLRMYKCGLSTSEIAKRMPYRISQQMISRIVNRLSGCSCERLGEISDVVSKYEELAKIKKRILG